MKNIDTTAITKPHPFRWADTNIQVIRYKEDLIVYGDLRMADQKDLLDSFENTNEPAPHVQFANCKTEEDLISFVERFGPINGIHAESRDADVELERFLERMERVDSHSAYLDGWRRWFAEESWEPSLAPYEFRGVIQNLEELRIERDVFRAALELTSLLLETATDPSGRKAKESKTETTRDRAVGTSQGPGAEAIAETDGAGTEGDAPDQGETQELVFDSARRGSDPTSEVKYGEDFAAPDGEQNVIEDIAAHLETIAAGTAKWTEQSQREQSQSGKGFPEWRWNDEVHARLLSHAASAKIGASALPDSWSSIENDPYWRAKDSIALLLNAFAPQLDWHGDAPMESPSSTLAHGIRPLLYALLRRDLLNKREFRRCLQPGCGKYFLAYRPDKNCCSPECSAKVSQKRHYHLKRKPARQRTSKLKSNTDPVPGVPQKGANDVAL